MQVEEDRVASGRGPAAALPAHRRTRADRRSAHHGPGRHLRHDRLVLLPSVRLPSVFAALLDADRGGRFRIAPDGDGWTSRQLYLPDTAVLITRFLTPDGVGEVQDFMPPTPSGETAHRPRLIRRVLAVRGRMGFLIEVAPRFDYARACHQVALTPHGALFRSPGLELALSTCCRLQVVDGGDVRTRVELRAGETATFVLDRVEDGEPPATPATGDGAPGGRGRLGPLQPAEPSTWQPAIGPAITFVPGTRNGWTTCFSRCDP